MTEQSDFHKFSIINIRLNDNDTLRQTQLKNCFEGCYRRTLKGHIMQTDSIPVDLKKTKPKVPEAHWKDLKDMSLPEVCRRTGAVPHTPYALTIRFLNKDLRIDLNGCRLYRKESDRWHEITDPLLELITLVYLLNAKSDPLSEEMIGINELKDSHFFQGPHAVDMSELLRHYGNNIDAFRSASLKLKGTPLELADAAFRFYPFPQAPVYYLLWEGDAEFSPHLSVLFDRSIERHFSADGIWGLIRLVNNALLGN